MKMVSMKLLSIFKNYIRVFKTDYVRNKVAKTMIPSFEPSPVVRRDIRFFGKVQKVGFRLEIQDLAKRLGLVGNVKNEKDDQVELEIQGEEKKILFVVDNMKKLKRANVTHVEISEVPLVRGEIDFTIKPRALFCTFY